MKLQKKTQPEKVSPMKALKERKSYVDSMQEELEETLQSSEGQNIIKVYHICH